MKLFSKSEEEKTINFILLVLYVLQTLVHNKKRLKMVDYRVLEMNEKDDEIDIDVGKLPPPLPVDASAPPPPDDLPSYEHCYRE